MEQTIALLREGPRREAFLDLVLTGRSTRDCGEIWCGRPIRSTEEANEGIPLGIAAAATR